MLLDKSIETQELTNAVTQTILAHCVAMLETDKLSYAHTQWLDMLVYVPTHTPVLHTHCGADLHSSSHLNSCSI